MVANMISPEEHCRDFIEKLQSSNLHYVVQETPFSLYVTVRKRFRAGPSTPPPPATTSKFASESAFMMLENELRLKNIDLKNAETTIRTLKESVEKEKETVQLLEEKVELAESEVYKTWERVKKEKAKDSDTINYLRDAEKRSSEESISMERKLVVANRKAKNNEKENIDVLNKLEELEKTNKKLIDKVRALEIVEANFEALKTDLDDIKHSEKVTKHVSTAYR